MSKNNKKLNENGEVLKQENSLKQKDVVMDKENDIISDNQEVKNSKSHDINKDKDLDIDLIKGKYEDLKKQFEDEKLRNAANIKNLQMRYRKEVEDAHKYSSKKFAQDMLIIKDYLEAALQDQSGIENLKMGVDLTLKELIKVFKNSNIFEINVKIGDSVDPNIHAVVSKLEDATKQPNTILQITRKGYKFHDRVLRAAEVVASETIEKNNDKNINDLDNLNN